MPLELSQPASLATPKPVVPGSDVSPTGFTGDSKSDVLHREIAAALLDPSFKRDAAGTNGEVLKIAVERAIAEANITVEVISVGLADPESHSASPYEAVWQQPGNKIEKSYFDV